MRFWLLTAVVAALIPPAAARPTAAADGTYAVWICPDGCGPADTAAAPVAGVLVLSPKPIPDAELPAEVRRASMFLLSSTSAATACFRLTTRSAQRSTFAGSIPRGATTWTQHGDTVRVLLYASPDAFYTLTALVQDGRLVGLGRESGFVGAAFDDPAGAARGLRTGPADVRQCFGDTR